MMFVAYRVCRILGFVAYRVSKVVAYRVCRSADIFKICKNSISTCRSRVHISAPAQAKNPGSGNLGNNYHTLFLLDQSI